MDPSSEGGRMTWHDVAKRRTLLDFSSMNDFGEDVVTSSSVEYGRFQLGLFLSGVFIIALYVYAEFLHYMRIKRMHNSSYNKGLAEDSIEMRMAGTKRFDVLLEGGNKSAPDVSLSSSMQGMNDEDKKRSFANFTDSYGRNNSQFFACVCVGFVPLSIRIIVFGQCWCLFLYMCLCV